MAAVALTEPETAKAATVTPGGAMTFFSFPVTKTEEGEDGTLKLWGRATDGSLDSDLQIVDPDWSAKALREWYDTGANVRVQHQAQRDPAGKGFEVSGHDIGVTVVEPVAVKLVKAGVLQDFSVGIINPDIRRGDPRFKHLDPAGKAVNGVITGRPDGLSKIGEVSLVDRGSNYGTRFAVVKAAADGSPEYVGELTAPDDVLAKVAEPDRPKTVTVELPKNMSLSVKPSDLAKLATFKQRLTQQVKAPEPVIAKVVGEHGPVIVKMDSTDEIVTPAFKAAMAAEATVYKRDIDTATRRRLAGQGRALPNLSYPIETHEDASNAVTLALSGHGDVGAAKNLIRRIARKEGWQDVLDRLKGGKKKAGKTAAKPAAAVPQVTKKAAAAEVAKKKKIKVMCPNCGAKQNIRHNNCPECGKPLPRAMPAVVKNHDFACLGCGHDLDKGEKFCPHCGRENPGYNAMADHKIPANKAAKERVSKRKKAKGKGGEPFGGKKALPFGAKDDDGDADGKPGKAEKRRSKIKAKAKVKIEQDTGSAGDGDDDDDDDARKSARAQKRRGGRKTPADGVKGQEGSTRPVPGHREPDGPAVEAFEAQAGMGDGDAEMKAAMRHKSLAALGVSRDEAVLHDLCCPAFSPESVAAALPYATFATIDDAAWQQKALATAAEAPLEQAGTAMAMWQHAVTLKNADPELLHDLRAEQFQAFLAANKGARKAFRDATPGPGSFPTPGHVTPGQFRRPYLSEGHASPSPMHEPARTFSVPEGQLNAQDYTRGYLTAGHAADSPMNDTPRHMPQPAPAEAGKPDRVYYRGTMRDNARQAMTAMHDHIARIFPDVCPTSPELGETQKPAPQVPAGVGGPEPHRAGKAAKASARKAAKAAARKKAASRRRLRKRVVTKVMNGKMTVTKARKALGLREFPGLGVLPVPAPSSPPDTAPAGLDADALKAAVADAMTPVLERQAGLEKTIRRQRKALDVIASRPDTSRAPLRGVMAVQKTSAAPAGPLSVAKSAEQAQAMQLQLLHHEWRNSDDPAQREAAYAALKNQLGLNPMPPQT